MRNLSWSCLICLAIAGCPDAEDPATDDDTGTGSGSETGGSPTSAPPTTTLPGDDGDDDGSGDASATGSTGEPPATGDDTGPATGDDTGADTDTGSESGTGGGGDAGVCVAACREDADCCAPGSIGCPSDEYPNNWTCVEGACQFGGCSEDAECASIIPIGDPQCLPVSGVGACVEPCANDNDCPIASGLECVGTTDDGTMYCSTPADPCEDDDDCGGSGTCDVDSGACVCSSADDCTDPDLGACLMSR